MPPALASGLRIAGHICRLLLSAVFLMAGVLKAPDPEGFAREVASYGIVSGWGAAGVAYVLIPLELAVGLALLLNFRARLSLAVTNLLMVVFIGAIGFALATGQPLESCGCFGSNAPRTPQQTLLEDLGFLAAGVIGMMVLRPKPSRDGVRPGRWKPVLVAVAAAGSGAFVVAAPYLPIDNLATSLAPGVTWKSLGVALAEVDMTQGEHLVVLMGLTEPQSQEAVDALNELAGSLPVTGLHTDDDAAFNEFFWTRGPAFPLYYIASSDMKRLHRRLPRVFAIAGGTVTATWNGAPDVTEAGRALQGDGQ